MCSRLIGNTEPQSRHLSLTCPVASRHSRMQPNFLLRLSLRLESQMTSDIQAILQLLQRQTTAGPPAYSTVTSSPEYQRPAIRVQPGSALPTDLSLAPAPPRPQVRRAREEGGCYPDMIKIRVLQLQLFIITLTINGHYQK